MDRELDRRRSQGRSVAALGRQALAGGDPAVLFAAAAEAVRADLGAAFAWVLRREGEGLSVRAASGLGGAVPAGLRLHPPPGSDVLRCLDASGPVAVQAAGSPGLVPDLAALGLRSGASVAIGPPGEPWGVLGAYATLEDGEPDEDDLAYLSAVAHVLWSAASARPGPDADREREMLLGLAETMPILFSVVDRDRRYEFVNRAYAAWGQPLDRMIGRSVREVVGDETYALVAPHLDAVLLEGRTERFEVTLALPGLLRPRVHLVTYTPRRAARDGAITGAYVAAVDITQQKELEADLRMRAAQYREIGEAIPFGVWLCDAEGRLTYASQSFLDLVGLDFAEAREFGWLRRLLPEDAEATRIAWEETVRQGTVWEREHRFLGTDDRPHHILAIGRPVRGEDGRITSWVGLNVDITERKNREERLAIVSAELDHRVKNILAVASTVARMTGRTATSLDDYRDSLEARFHALAKAHQMLAEGGWNGMSFRDLLCQELGPWLGGTEQRVTLEGPDFVLPPAMIQPMALCLHELATNAAKHGALRSAGGRLDLGWNKSGAGEVTLLWTETCPEPIAEAGSRGFGSAVLDQVVPAQLKARVDRRFEPHGLRVEIVFPLSRESEGA